MSEFYETGLAVQLIFLRYKLLIKLEKIKVMHDVKFVQS